MDAALLMSERGWDLLVAYVADELPPADRDAIRELSARNSSIAERIKEVTAMLGSLDSVRADAADWSVSRELRQRLIALRPKPRAGWIESVASQVREVLAALVLDSRAGSPALAGFRGAAGDRHMIFDADSAEIDVRVSRGTATTVHLLGQVHAGPALNELRLRSLEDGPEAGAPIDADGVFELEVPAGLYELALVGPASRITIPSLELKVT